LYKAKKPNCSALLLFDIVYSLARVLSAGNLGVKNKCDDKAIKTQDFSENENQNLKKV
jgi:hypothetical protein